MSNSFLESIAKRRTIYHIGKDVKLSQDQITSIIEEALQQSPSAFNSQSSRAAILFDQSHLSFWNLVLEKLRKIVPADAFPATEQRILSFAAGVGTVLFFENQDVVRDLQQQFALYADYFPTWSEHSTGIAQFAVWSALANVDIGASLQHYNPIVDDQVHAKFDLPENWKLCAQLVFGSIESSATEKTFIDPKHRIKVIK